MRDPHFHRHMSVKRWIVLQNSPTARVSSLWGECQSWCFACSAAISGGSAADIRYSTWTRFTQTRRLTRSARLLEGLCVGQRADAIAHFLVDVARDLAHGAGRALGLQRADRAITF